MTGGQWILLCACIFVVPGAAAIAVVIGSTRLRRQHDRDP